MKKILFTLLGLIAVLGASATNYVVWSGDDLTSDEEQINVTYYGWWNVATSTVDDADSSEGKAFKISCANWSDNTACSCGWDCNDWTILPTLADYDLVFDVKLEGTGDFWICVTTRNSDTDTNNRNLEYHFDLTADGAYHTVRLNMAEVFPDAIDEWKSPTMNRYVFAGGINNSSEDGALYFANVHYESAIPLPSITASASDITANTANINYEVTFPTGYSNTAITINDQAVTDNPGTLAFTNLTAKTSYTYTITATGEYEGVSHSTSKTVSFTTDREAGDEPMYYGILQGADTDTYVVTAYYWVRYNTDKTVTVYVEYEGLDIEHNHKINLQNGDDLDNWKTMTQEGNGWIYDSVGTFEEGETLNGFFWFEYAGGVWGGNYHFIFTIGTTTDPWVKGPSLTASAENVTYNSADIAYKITVPAGLASATTKLYMDDVEQTIIDLTGTIALTDLTEETQYSHVLKVVSTLDGETYESKEVTVSFKTKSSTVTDKVYKGYCPAAFTNAYLVGESDSDRRDLYLNLPFTITYDEEGTLTYEIDLTQCKDVVGLVPQLYCDGWFNLTQGENNKWSVNVGAVTEGGATNIAHFMPYNGGGINLNFSNKYPTYGYEGDLTTIGTTTEIAKFTASGDIIQTQVEPCEISVGAFTPALLSIVGTDSNGYYTSEEYTLELPNGVMLNNGALSVNQHGDFTVTAKMGNATKNMIIHCQRNSESKNLIPNMTPESDDAENPANATDGNSETYLFWNCSSSEAHSFTLNFGGNYYVESIEVLFETARAKNYAVTLYNATETASLSISPKAAAENNVITVENNTNNLNVLRNEKAQEGTYSSLKFETSAANVAGWGIKVKEIQVYGSESTPTGVQNVAVDNADTDAPVEYYNLQGIRLSQPAAGQIVIRRQGSTVSKIKF